MKYVTLRSQAPVFRGELDRIFDDFWTLPSHAKTAAWSPAAEIDEAADHFLVSLELPGLKREELSIEVTENQVVISGERKAPEKRGLYTERQFGKFQRTFSLPGNVDSEKIEAHFENGVLNVRVPKVEAVKPRQIPIGGTK